MASAGQASPIERWGRGRIGEIFGADLRSLAAFRIVLAVIVLADLAGRAANLSVHYTDDGVLPRRGAIRELNEWQFSLNLINGTTFFQAVLFGVAALAACALLVGYRTRQATVVVWLMMLSIQWRNPLVLSDADTLLRVLLFWAMFLPLGAYWSVDRARDTTPARISLRFLSWATAAVLLQIAFMYWFTVILKSGREWRHDGTALYYALSAQHLTTPLGDYLRQYPAFLKVLTFGTLGLEAFGPILLFVPVLTRWLRTLAVIALMSLHFGILQTMNLGLFPWLSAFSLVCFLPSQFWDVVVPRVSIAFPEVGSLARWFRQAAVRLAPVSIAPVRNRVAAWAGAGPSAGVDMMAHAGVGSTGVLGGHPRTPPPVAGRADAEPMALRSSLVTNLLAAAFLIYVFLWNVMTVSDFTVPDPIRPFGNLLGLKQSWNMFAPRPSTATGWYVVPGALADARQVDLLPFVVHDDPNLASEVSWSHPQNFDELYGNKYWRKYLGAIRTDSVQRRYFAEYICREWNATHTGPSKLVTLEIVYVSEKTLPDQQRAAPKRDVLSQHSCD